MGATSLGRQFTCTLDEESAAAVHSFGIGKIDAGPGHPPLICLALGVEGELDAPATLTMDLEQAAALITLLQSNIDAARWAGRQ
jgi:hypothetical protein